MPAALVSGQVATAALSSAGTTITATLPAAPTVGNLMVAYHHTRGGTVTIPTGWAVARTETQGGVTGRIMYRVVQSGDTGCTVVVSAANLQTLTLIEVSGLLADQATVLDQATGQNTGTSTTVTTQSTGTTGSTTVASGFAVAAIGLLGNGVTWANTWTNGFTQRSTVASGGTPSTGSSHTVATKVTSALAAYETTESWNNALRAQGLIAVFKTSASPIDDLDYAVVGAQTATGATVTACTVTTGNVRLAVSTSADLSSPTWFGPVTPDADKIAKLAATGLSANTTYYFGVEVGGNLSPKQGTFKTLPAPGTAATFKIALGSCAMYRQNADATTQYPVSVHPVWDAIGAQAPLFFLHMGDLHYQDIDDAGAAARDAMRAAYKTVFTSAKQSTRFRNTPLVYTWSDHDYGANDSDSTTASKADAQTVYRQVIPHQTLPDPAAIYHKVDVGRVRFLVLDCRSNKTPRTATDDATKTMLGATQKQWVKDQITAAPADGMKLVTLVSDVPWIWSVASGDAAGDSWGAYTTERQELADHIVAAGMGGRVCLLAGDAHMVAIDNGTNNAWGGFPVFVAAALDRDGAVKGGPYSSGTFPNESDVSGAQGQYGTMTVTDTGGPTVSVTWSGRRVTNGGAESELTSLTFTAGTPAQAVDVSESGVPVQPGADVTTAPPPPQSVDVAASPAVSQSGADVAAAPPGAQSFDAAATTAVAQSGADVTVGPPPALVFDVAPLLVPALAGADVDAVAGPRDVTVRWGVGYFDTPFQ